MHLTGALHTAGSRRTVLVHGRRIITGVHNPTGVGGLTTAMLDGVYCTAPCRILDSRDIDNRGANGINGLGAGMTGFRQT